MSRVPFFLIAQGAFRINRQNKTNHNVRGLGLILSSEEFMSVFPIS